MPWYFIVLIALVASVIISVLISLPLYLAIMTTHPKCESREMVSANWEKERFTTEYDKSQRIDITFQMNDGYIIHGDYMLYPGSKKFVVCCHGYLVNREAELEYGLIFYRLGYNIVLYDERRHGDNEKTLSTMGYLETLDLNQIIDQLKAKFGSDISIGLHGVSMGANVAMQINRYRDDIKFIIEDCGYISFVNILKGQIDHGHLPGVIFCPLASFTCKLLYGFSFKKTSIDDIIEKIKTPVLIIHGDIDEAVPVKDAYTLNERLKSKHKMVIYHSLHANSLTDYKEDYIKEIKAFLEEVDKPQIE